MGSLWARHRACGLTAALTCAVVTLPAIEASAGPESTYSVGIQMDSGWDVTVGRDGSAIVTGSTATGFQPTLGAVNRPGGDSSPDAFVLKVDPTGRVVYGAVLGGRSSAQGSAVTVADDGSVFLAGFAESDDFPTTVGVIARNDTAPRDPGTAFLAKLSPDGSELEWSTLLPGVRSVHDLAVDEMGRSHLVGEAYDDLPLSADAFDTHRPTDGAGEAFVGTVNPRGTRWVGASYFGGGRDDLVAEIELAPDGGAYVSGATRSADFPTTPGSYDQNLGGSQDAFVAKITGDGSGLAWSTFLGGAVGDPGREYEAEEVQRLDVDASGRVVVEGSSNNDDFPTTPGASYPVRPGYFEEDSFVARITPDGSQLDLATFLPGATWGVAMDRDSRMHLVSYHGPDDEPGSPIGPSSVVDLELDEAGDIVDVHPVPGPDPMDFDVDAAGTVYLLGTAWPKQPARAQRVHALAGAGAALGRFASCTVRGSNGGDILRGTNGPDVICAGAGSDVIRGRGGYDIVRAGQGRDRILGGKGIDVLNGGSGSDRLNGSWRRDLLIGGSGADILTGGSGGDSLRGAAGRDRLWGGQGPDGLRGGPDRDWCAGGNGRDHMSSCES